MNHHTDNIEGSVVVLRSLSDEWKQHAANLAPYDMLRQTLEYIKQEVIHFSFVVVFGFIYCWNFMAYICSLIPDNRDQCVVLPHRLFIPTEPASSGSRGCRR